ncbi:hypothetical protein HKX48_001021 [Thoreauomyces humboldtii]|nr:hypothetical protein HKX48_001021 [Thoreauomyces humboldtii]
MNECPVCGRALDARMSQTEVEEHVKECLDGVRGGDGKETTSVAGTRFLVQVLKEDLGGRECAICFDDFLQGKEFLLGTVKPSLV